MAEKRRFGDTTRRYSNGAVTQVPGQIGNSAGSKTIVFDPNRPGNPFPGIGGLKIPYNTTGRRMSTNVEDRRSPLMPTVSQFGQLPQPFQDRFRQRQQMGLNQGMSEQDAIDFYNTNYISGAPLPPPAGPAQSAGRQVTSNPYVDYALTGVDQALSRAEQMLGRGADYIRSPRLVRDLSVGAQNVASGIGQTLMGADRMVGDPAFQGGLAKGARGIASGIAGTARTLGEAVRPMIERAGVAGYQGLRDTVAPTVAGMAPGAGRGLREIASGVGDTIVGAGRMPGTLADSMRTQPRTAITSFSELPQEFQDRFRQRTAAGLNVGVTEQQAVDAYNQLYVPRVGSRLPPNSENVIYGSQANIAPTLPGGVQGPLPQTGAGLRDPRRVAAISDMFDLAGLQIPEAVRPMVQEIRSARSAGAMADELQGQRESGQGIYGGPTQQERDQFDADVQRRIQENPSPVNEFQRQELMGRTAEGRAMNLRDLQLGYLSRPMQGGMLRGSSSEMGRDREQRLSMLSAMNPPAERGPVPMATVIGPEQPSDRRELRLAGLPARREADRLAVANRLDRMRQGRMAMRANQQAAERQAFEMATNPLVNPMLLRGNPYAMTEAMRLGQQQREFEAEAPVRQARTIREALETEGLRLQNEASRRMLSPEAQTQQRIDFARNELSKYDLTTYATMPPQTRQYIDQLIQEASGAPTDVQGGPSAPPASAVEAQGRVEQLSPTVQTIINDDPSGYNAEQLAYKIKTMQDAGMQFSPQDIQTLNDYGAARSMYDLEYATTGRTRASKLFEALTTPNMSTASN